MAVVNSLAFNIVLNRVSLPLQKALDATLLASKETRLDLWHSAGIKNKIPNPRMNTILAAWNKSLSNPIKICANANTNICHQDDQHNTSLRLRVDGRFQQSDMVNFILPLLPFIDRNENNVVASWFCEWDSNIQYIYLLNKKFYLAKGMTSGRDEIDVLLNDIYFPTDELLDKWVNSESNSAYCFQLMDTQDKLKAELSIREPIVELNLEV